MSYYLEDTSIDCDHDASCNICGHPVEEATHYLDSETLQWQCDGCGQHNEIRQPDCTEADPDL